MIHILMKDLKQTSFQIKKWLKFYKKQLKFVKNDQPLEYYFFKQRNLFKDVKEGIKSIYKQYKEKV